MGAKDNSSFFRFSSIILCFLFTRFEPIVFRSLSYVWMLLKVFVVFIKIISYILPLTDYFTLISNVILSLCQLDS
jgi:hypothetical protein